MMIQHATLRSPLVCASLILGAVSIGSALAQRPAIPQTEGASVVKPPATPDPNAAAMEERIESLAQEVRSHPDDAELLATYGLSLVRYGRHDEGLNALMRASAKAPEEPRVALLYSKALLRVKSFEQAAVKALKVVDSPLATKKEIGEACSVAGYARYRQGNAEQAEKYLREAVAHMPQDAGANLNLGLVIYSTGQVAKGISLMEKAALLAPDDPRIQRIIAGLYDTLGQSEKSLEAWEVVSTAYPADIEIRLKLAAGWLALNRADRSLPHLQSLAATPPPNRRVQILLSTAYSALGEFENARAHAEEARRLGANVTDLLQRIANDEAAESGYE